MNILACARLPDPVFDRLDLSPYLVQHEPVAPGPNRRKLADLMEDRRKNLRLKWSEVALRASITTETLRQVRFGESEIRDLTKRAIEVGLDWEPGTVDAILRGEDPPHRSVTGTMEAILPALQGSARGQVLAQDDALIESIWASPLPDEDKLELVRIVLDERADADRRAADRFAERLRWHNRQAQ